MAELDVRAWADKALEGFNGADPAQVQQAIQLLQVKAAADDTIPVGEPPVRTLEEYLAQEIPEPPALVNPGQVVKGAITCTTSPGGKGKTTMSLNRLLRWSMGKPMFDELSTGMVPVKPLRSLIIENEGAAGFFQSRVQLLAEKGMDPTDEERELMMNNIMVWGDGGWSSMKLDDKSNVDLIRRAAEIHQPDIIFLEPFRTLWQGDENSSTEMVEVIDALNAMATEYELAVMLTHHERKSGAGDSGEGMFAARGSAVLSDLVGVMERWRPVQAGQQRELSWTKWRFAEPHAPVRMQFNASTWRYSYIGDNEKHNKLLQILETSGGEWEHTNEIAEQAGESVDETRKMLNKLKDEKRVKSTNAPRQPGMAGSPGKMWRTASPAAEDGEGMEF